MAVPEGLATLKIDRTQRRSASNLWMWALLPILAGGAAFAVPQLKFFQEVEVSVVPVTKAHADPSAEGSNELTAAGYVVADRQSVLAFKGTGMLMKLNVAESQRVTKGEVIAEIDHRELDAQILQSQAAHEQTRSEILRLKKAAAQAELELEAAKLPLATLDAQIVEIQVRLADAKRRLEQAKSVVNQGAMSAVPWSIVDDRETEVKMAEAQTVTANKQKDEVRLKIKVAEAALETARAAIPGAEAAERAAAANEKILQEQLVDAYIYSPYDGVVTEKAAEIGEIVAPISIGGSMARGSIATIAEWSSLQAEVDVAETYISRVKPGQRAAITIDAFPEKVFAGKVRRILPHANRSKATVLVRVDFVKPVEGMLPDMGVRVKFLPDDAPAGIETGTVKTTLVVPAAALQQESNAKVVWTFADGKAHKQKVEAGQTRGNQVEIVTGIKIGDQVIIRGIDKLNEDGQKVRVAKE